MIKLTGLRTSSAVSKIYDTLRCDIVMGNLHPRERLIEADLADRFGHSRATIREVLSMLLQVGLVRVVPNKGASVAESTSHELENIYRVRVALEATAASWIRLPVGSAAIEELEMVQAEHTRAVDERRLGDVFQLNDRFHALLNSHCGNPYQEELIRTMADRGIIGRYSVSMDQKYLEGLKQDHLGIIEAIKREDSGTLVDVVRLHLLRGRDWYARHRAQYGPVTVQSAA